MQHSFAELAWNNKKRRTRREAFLSEMQGAIPWKELEKLIKPHAPKETPGEDGGRPGYGVSVMVRIYFCQQWYQLSDEGMEDSLYDSESVRRFCGLRLESDAMPDETSIMRFRHLLEKHRLQERMFERVNRILEQRGLLMRQGTIVDATIINAPSSTKNKEQKRDSEMSQTRKGNQWYFGMKMHAGIDEKSGVVHTLRQTTARTSDISQIGKLLHGKENTIRGDRAYCCKKRGSYFAKIGIRLLTPKKKPIGKNLSEWDKERNRQLSSKRAIGEHAFLVIKNIFRYRKTRYKGLFKNACQQFTLAFLANIYRMRRHLAPSPT